MKKLLIFISIAFVIAAAGLFTFTHYFKPYLKNAILEYAKDNLGKSVSIESLDVRLSMQKIALKGLSVEGVAFIKYPADLRATQLVFIFDIFATLLNRGITLRSVYLEDMDLSVRRTQNAAGDEISLPAKVAGTERHEPTWRPFDLFLANLNIEELIVDNMRLKYVDHVTGEEPLSVEISGINGIFKDVHLPFNFSSVLIDMGKLEGDLNDFGEGNVKLNGTFSKKEGLYNFDLDIAVRDANLIKFAPYYEKTSFSVLKEATIDLHSKSQCVDNNLLAVQNVRIYDIELNDIQPKNHDVLFGLPAGTVIDFFDKYKKDIKFDFRITGTIDDPKFSPGPVIKEILSTALRDKIIAKLQDLPREMMKIGEKAIKDLEVREKLWELDEEIEKIKKEMNKIMEYDKSL
ncbi:MAG: DUF748 domain-containing protein [Candidatus Omnitrophica bacterium]|nr:DUF748 domain-containing protein [Candidatus Omnitrophota bacterium]